MWGVGKAPGHADLSITEQEFSNGPHLFRATIAMTGAAPGERTRSHARAVREARKELACADQTLRQCYDYLEEAREEANKPDGKPTHAAYAVYKAMEVLKERFGNSDARAVKVFGKVFKQAKQAANEERHIRKKDQPRSNVSGRSVELARETIRAYERYLMKSRSLSVYFPFGRAGPRCQRRWRRSSLASARHSHSPARREGASRKTGSLVSAVTV